MDATAIEPRDGFPVGCHRHRGREPTQTARLASLSLRGADARHRRPLAAAERGEDAAAVIASFGLSVVDWSNASMFWNKKQQQEAAKYYHLCLDYSAKYAAKYRR